MASEDIHTEQYRSDNPDTNFIFKLTSPCTILPSRLKVAQVSEDIVFPRMCKDVSDCKCKIDIDENSKHWDKAKRKTNPYELVHMIGTNHLLDEVLPPNKSVENFSPLSRAFFKMLEIYDILGRLISKSTYTNLQNNSLQWDTDNKTGSGLYFYRVKTNSHTSAGKLMLLK